MLTTDDERTLQVLEEVHATGHVGVKGWYSAYVSGLVMQEKRKRGYGWVLTDAGRAELDRLWEKKGRGE